ncbi:hypothetical protein [Virgibacillus siamensis]|uniref:hypothetical protein n=1 Tax=Virgibacillus siamensis TaxID=480071 RepID=UPI001C37DCE3|nr:hypothetical protein [Virgibacillus siamensis]
MTMTQARTLSISIERNSKEVYEYVFDPENLPQWAPAFSQSLKEYNGAWVVETSDGPMTIRFVERNELGVLDHYVTPSTGQKVLNPMRVIPNGFGSEVMFTLFQLPEMSDEKFAEDAKLVESDLKRLKSQLEAQCL